MLRKYEKQKQETNPYYVDEKLKELTGDLTPYEHLCYEAMILCKGVVSEIKAWAEMYGFTRQETVCFIRITDQAYSIFLSELEKKNAGSRTRT